MPTSKNDKIVCKSEMSTHQGPYAKSEKKKKTKHTFSTHYLRIEMSLSVNMFLFKTDLQFMV